MKNIKKKNSEIFSFLEKIISKKGKIPGKSIIDIYLPEKLIL